MRITIKEFLFLCIDNYYELEIWDNLTNEVVWKGTMHDVPYEFEDLEVDSWNPINGGICLNVCLEDELM